MTCTEERESNDETFHITMLLVNLLFIKRRGTKLEVHPSTLMNAILIKHNLALIRAIAVSGSNNKPARRHSFCFNLRLLFYP